MACGKMREKLFGFFTCLVLVECRSVPIFPETLERNDGRSGSISERPVPVGFDGSLPVFHSLADSAGVGELQRINGQHFSSSEVAWDAMSPKLRCGADLMKLRLNGPEVAQILLCRDNGAPVPLTELPPHCGHSSPTVGGLVYVTPYDGCGVTQEGRRYVIRIRWHGKSAVVSCPMVSTSANGPFLGPNPPVKPQAPEYPQTFLQSFWPYNYPYYKYPGAVYPTRKPTVAPVPTQKPQQPFDSQVFWPDNYPYYKYSGAVYPTAKPTVAPVPTQKPQQPFDSQVFWPYNYPYYKYPGAVYPTRKPTVAPVPTQKPQQPFDSQVFWPDNYPYYKYPGAVYPTAKPTVAPVPTQKPQQPLYSQVFWPYNYPYYKYPGAVYPTRKPTVAPVPTQKPQQPFDSQVFWPYNYPYYYYPGAVYPTRKPTVALVPTQKPQQHFDSLFWPYYYYPRYLDNSKTPRKPVPTQKPQLQG